MVMLFGKQISVSTTTSHQHQEDDPSNNPPLMGSLGGVSKTRVFVPGHHHENPQDSDRAAGNSDVNLASEVDFLGLMRAQDPTVVLNPEPLRWFHPSSNRILHSGFDVNHGEVGSCSYSQESESDDPTTVVLNPEPLRWFYSSGDGASSSNCNFDFVSDGKKKRKSSSRDDDDENNKMNLRRKKIKKNYPQVPTIDLSSEFRSGIIGQTIQGPVFVYRKKLEGSDVNKRLNRLLITEEEKLVDGFLSGDECEMFHGGRGVKIDVFGVDGRGREYELRLSKWKTVIVINSEWYKMVVANGAVAGDWVDLWGFRREDAQIRFVVNFISSQATSDHHHQV